MRQAFIFLNFIVITIVTSKIEGYIFPTSEPEEILDDELDKSWRLLRFVPSSEWRTFPMPETTEKLKLPVPYVMIYHTGTESCFYRQSCDQIVQSLQAKYAVTHPGDRDIGYNFMISGDGHVYVGRGWESAGVHTLGMNKKSIGIALVGSFHNQNPSTNQYFALMNLIKFGVYYHLIQKEFQYYSEPDMNLLLDSQKKIENIHQLINAQI